MKTPLSKLIFPVLVSLFFSCSDDDRPKPVTRTGGLWMWGNNAYGALGDGSNEGKTSPVHTSPGTIWKEVSTGNFFTVAIKDDGTLWSWGENSYGQLGNGTTIPQNIPTQIGSETNWKTVSAGSLHVLAIKTDGSLWAWGRNANGQLGIGTQLGYELAPIRVGNEQKWSQVSAGENYSLALKTDKSLWAWGANDSYQLGDETYETRTSPTQIGTAKNWKQISAGFANSFAIKTDNSLWAWGNNQIGQFGVGIAQPFFLEIPYQISEQKNWSKISNGHRHVLAIRTDGTLWAWGHNSFGQVGDGTTEVQAMPVKIGVDKTWTSISAGDTHSLAMKKDGSVWSWGFNAEGQIGNPEMTEQLTPFLVPSDQSWNAIATAPWSTFSAGIKKDF